MPQSLAERLKQPGLVVAPGVFDGITARIADSLGFDALYMTGYGSVASALGLPDAGLATYTDMVGRVRMISSVTSAPLIADGDTAWLEEIAGGPQVSCYVFLFSGFRVSSSIRRNTSKKNLQKNRVGAGA
jgi:hypothetical protein